ncbi:glycosyltransferase [Lactiplantibacillus argentoratensis]|uniref:glycosyltransferase n=1 Tax=Lactiplantibacillus argentoratensis TaxID=271881 RepID=UPI001B33A2F6|nr:glycosyltransferase [Lactiplantibacillus argentoratensis]MBP5810099.1 glycosyltransferase [Lactiplantibacillus argentoratensis]
MGKEKMPKVFVLLSTYNGEKYLKQQINSILAQKDVDVELRIRDDGSTDKTVSFLKKFADLKNVTVSVGENLGWRKSFMSLLENAPIEENAYYAFSDQDDIWKSLKMSRALSLMNNDQPMAYHSNVTIIDGQEKVISNRFAADFKPTNKMPVAFLNGYGVGATMVFNCKLLRLTRKFTVTRETNHDAYVMALAGFLGKVVYDKESFILYRRHDNTATGFGHTKRVDNPTILMRYKRYKKNPKNNFSIRAEMILNGYGFELSGADHRSLKWLAQYRNNFKYKLCLLLSPEIHATGLRKTLQVKYRILMNTL